MDTFPPTTAKISRNSVIFERISTIYKRETVLKHHAGAYPAHPRSYAVRAKRLNCFVNIYVMLAKIEFANHIKKLSTHQQPSFYIH
jgi:hypothetical protein